MKGTRTRARTGTRTTEVTTIALRTRAVSRPIQVWNVNFRQNCQTSTKVILKCWLYLVLRPPSCFTGIETNGSVSGTKTGGTKTGVSREKHLTHPQAELGLSTLPECAMHPQGDMVE